MKSNENSPSILSSTGTYSKPLNPSDEKAVGIRMHEARKSLHMTQEELARRVGISAGYVSCLERGLRPLTHHILPHILRNLNLSYEYLIYGTPPSHSSSFHVLRESSAYDTYFKLEKLLEQCSKDEYEMCYQLCNAYLTTARQNPAYRISSSIKNRSFTN